MAYIWPYVNYKNTFFFKGVGVADQALFQDGIEQTCSTQRTSFQNHFNTNCNLIQSNLRPRTNLE